MSTKPRDMSSVVMVGQVGEYLIEIMQVGKDGSSRYKWRGVRNDKIVHQSYTPVTDEQTCLIEAFDKYGYTLFSGQDLSLEQKGIDSLNMMLLANPLMRDIKTIVDVVCMRNLFAVTLQGIEREKQLMIDMFTDVMADYLMNEELDVDKVPMLMSMQEGTIHLFDNTISNIERDLKIVTAFIEAVTR